MSLANLNIRHAFLGDPPQPLRKVVIIVMIADGIPAELKCGSGMQQAQTQLVVFEAAGEGDIEATYLLKERGGHRHITAEKITVCEAVPRASHFSKCFFPPALRIALVPAWPRWKHRLGIAQHHAVLVLSLHMRPHQAGMRGNIVIQEQQHTAAGMNSAYIPGGGGASRIVSQQAQL